MQLGQSESETSCITPEFQSVCGCVFLAGAEVGGGAGGRGGGAAGAGGEAKVTSVTPADEPPAAAADGPRQYVSELPASLMTCWQIRTVTTRVVSAD